MQLSLPRGVEYIIGRLESCGFRADAVGGCVRDLLLGRTPYDFDVTTDATPEQTKEAFSHLRTIDTGIKHGTVTVMLEGEPYEVTTYRIDGEYKDSRHPETVAFTRRIEDDLARRDFTVNALAYSPSRGITDPFYGRDDLDRRLIRAVGDADKRFCEDALRILRGVRFSAVLGFDIESATSSAIHRRRDLLKNVSAERIFTELYKTLDGAYAYGVLRDYSDVLLTVIPTLDRLILPDESAFSISDMTSRLLSIFYLSSDDPASAFETFCRALHTDNRIRELGVTVLSSVGKYTLDTPLGLTLLLRDLGPERAEALIRLEMLLGRIDPAALSRLRELLSCGVCYRISDLKVGGRELMALGMDGPSVGAALDRLLLAVILGECQNDREALISFIEGKNKAIPKKNSTVK